MTPRIMVGDIRVIQEADLPHYDAVATDPPWGQGMATIVFHMLDNAWTDERVCAELGLEADELVRLKYFTGFAKLFENVEYRHAWESKRQIILKRDYVEPDAH